MTDKWGKRCMHGNGRCVKGNMAGIWEWCVPMSSVKPPTGSRQVPVTNWSRRILFSLSISFTTCRKLSPSSCCNVHNRYVCVCVCHTVCAYLPEPVNLLAVLGVVSINGVLLPICQVDLLHTTEHQLQHTENIRSSVASPQSFIHASIRGKSRQDATESNPIPNWNKIFSLANNVTYTPCLTEPAS